MNKLVESNQKQIFESQMTNGELEAITTLVNEHKKNAAITQQLALDASRLVASGQERLAKQSEAGFFKRFSGAISGKTSENQLQNQIDVLQMQKFAWHYLQQLQQQNLINAQSIAVIRNNLGTMNEYIIETRDFMASAIDKIDSRLRHVENNTRFNNWSLNIDANKRRYKSIPKNLLILRLTYDFLRNHEDVILTESDVNNYLITTLERLDINCDEDVKLLDFISELIDQIEVVGIDQYRATIELAFDEYTVDSGYILKNISGLGFNALYFLSDYYDKIVDLIGDEQLCNSDEAREKIISKLFGGEFFGLSTIYSIRNLICEMIGGSQVAIEVYKEEHGLNVVQDESSEEKEHEIESLVSSLPDIRSHTFLDSHDSNESKRNYLLLLGLCVEDSKSLNGLARDFIALLAEKYCFPDLQKEIFELADNPRKHIEYLPIMRALLDDEDKKYTWLFDAFFLLSLSQKSIENPQIKVIIGTLKPDRLKECLPNMLLIISERDTSLVLNAVVKLIPFTQGWKNIIRYRDLHFDQYFAEVDEKLYKASRSANLLNQELIDLSFKAIEHSSYISLSVYDGGLLNNLSDKAAAALCIQGRKSAVSNLNELRQKAGDCILENSFALSQGNSLISQWKLPTFEFKVSDYYSSFDLDNSVENEDWGDQFEHYYRQVTNALDDFSQACDGVREQLSLFINGDFDQSILRLREQKRAEKIRQKEQEKLEKQSATIIKNGKENFFTIEWEKINNPPCNPENINQIKTDGKIWFIAASVRSDEFFYRSEDGINWRQVHLDEQNIKICSDAIYVVNGIWIIKNRALSNGSRDDGIYYSEDAINWKHSPAPEQSKRELSINEGCMSFDNILRFNDLWLWRGYQYQKYSYIEKGFFSNSTKTDSYGQISIYCAQNLDGPWQPWDQTPKFPEGVEVKEIYALPGKKSLLAFCEYCSSFIRNKKKPETPPFVMHYGSAKAWRNCTWGGASDFRFSSFSPIVFNKGDKLVFFIAGEILSSDNGYEWAKQETKLNVDEHFPLKDFSLFTRNGKSSIYLTQDFEIFKELVLEKGNWSRLTANDQGMLGVYYLNEHEETVLRFGRYIYRAKI